MSIYPSNAGYASSAVHTQSSTDRGITASSRSMRVLRKKDVAKKIGCSVSTVDNRLNPSSPWYDETFPRPRELGAGGSRSSAKGWLEYLVDEWLESRKEAAYRG